MQKLLVRGFVLQALLAIVAASGSAAAPASPATHPHVIVISIDGLKGKTLSTLLDRHRNTPNLDEFLKGGAVADGMVGVFPTVTYPSHTTLVTGVPPDVHGIYGNTLFDPEHQMHDTWYWYSQAMRVPAIWDAARTRGLHTAAVSWPVTVGAAIDANFPEWRELQTLEDKLIYEDLCTPGLYAEYAKAYHLDPLSPPTNAGESDMDSEATRMAVFLLRTRKPDLLLLHVAETDHMQHLHGPDSEQEFQALERIDRDISQIREQVRASGLAGETIYVIVSDHGFLPVTQSFYPDAVLNSMGLLGSKDHPDQWRVATFFGGGSFGLIAHDPNDREAIDLARTTFLRLATESRWGIDHVYEGDELKTTGGFGNSFLAVSMKSGFAVGGESEGSWLAPEPELRGMHGFAPGLVELESSFLAFGPGIAPQRLGRHKAIDVAPTIAHMLGAELTEAQGTNIVTIK